MRRTTRFVVSTGRTPVRQEWCARVLRWLFESPASASCGERFRGRLGLPRNDVAFVSENGNRLSEELWSSAPAAQSGPACAPLPFPLSGNVVSIRAVPCDARPGTRRAASTNNRLTETRENSSTPRPRRPNAAPVVHQLRKLMDRCVCGFWWLHLRFPVTLRTRNSIDLPTASLYL